jgi:hypothetical protein
MFLPQGCLHLTGVAQRPPVGAALGPARAGPLPRRNPAP